MPAPISFSPFPIVLKASGCPQAQSSALEEELHQLQAALADANARADQLARELRAAEDSAGRLRALEAQMWEQVEGLTAKNERLQQCVKRKDEAQREPQPEPNS